MMLSEVDDDAPKVDVDDDHHQHQHQNQHQSPNHHHRLSLPDMMHWRWLRRDSSLVDRRGYMSMTSLMDWKPQVRSPESFWSGPTSPQGTSSYPRCNVFMG